MHGPVPADVFALLADPTRRRLIEVLHDGERSVGDLVEAVDIAQPGVSRHLRLTPRPRSTAARLRGIKFPISKAAAKRVAAKAAKPRKAVAKSSARKPTKGTTRAAKR